MNQRTFGLLISLSFIGAIACGQPTVTVDDPNPDEVLESLVGTWQMEERSTGELRPFKWIFSEEGQLTYTNLPAEPSTFVGLYRIDSRQTPMHMDLQLSNDDRLMLTIFEFTEEGNLRIPLGGISSVYRRDGFSMGDTILRKISDETNP